MPIICNILRFLGEEFLNRSLIQQRSAQNSQHFVGTPVQFEVMLNDSHHAICRDGRVYLDSDSSLCCTPKGSDLEMLFDPLKEEFYVPTIFIKESDLRGWCLHIIGQVDKCLVLVCRIVCDATKNSREFLAGLVSSKSDFNKYMIWRVRASWTKVTNRIGFLDNECSILETRLQVKF